MLKAAGLMGMALVLLVAAPTAAQESGRRCYPPPCAVEVPGGAILPASAATPIPVGASVDRAQQDPGPFVGAGLLMLTVVFVTISFRRRRAIGQRTRLVEHAAAVVHADRAPVRRARDRVAPTPTSPNA